MSGLGLLQTTMMESSSYNLNILILENFTYYDNMTSSPTDTSWLIFLVDRSQQVMTIVGVIANIGTSITLIKNGQVSVTSNTKWIYIYIGVTGVK